ncbi:unnamed protein product [Phyllotreta striolata]|uniref:Uncharacterized protein n=1 Tax=Phyllotreta striolata TaxID=444603 RepID=A0A9N9XQE5_PHYSR|nr:unnamed protein product [Phyllotreta striolata]
MKLPSQFTMNKLVLFSVLVVQVFSVMDPKDISPALKQLMIDLHAECGLISGATDQQIDAVRHGDFNIGIEMKRYIGCIWLHSGVMNGTGHANTDFLISLEPPKLKGKFHKYLVECVEELNRSTEPDYLQKLVNAEICYYNKDPEHFMFP